MVKILQDKMCVEGQDGCQARALHKNEVRHETDFLCHGTNLSELKRYLEKAWIWGVF